MLFTCIFLIFSEQALRKGLGKKRSTVLQRLFHSVL